MGTDTQLLLIAGGIAVIFVALGWRLLARQHQVGRVEHQLVQATEPVERARAGGALVDLGLRRAARPVLAAMANEHDDRVRLSVALAVGRRQWEPASVARVSQLRAWASDELDHQGHKRAVFPPALTRLSDMGGPRPTEQTEPSAPAAAPTPPAAPVPSAPAAGSTTATIPAVAAPDSGAPAAPDRGGIHWSAPPSPGSAS